MDDGLAWCHRARCPAVNQPVGVLPELRHLHSRPAVRHGHRLVRMVVRGSLKCEAYCCCACDAKKSCGRYEGSLHGSLLCQSLPNLLRLQNGNNFGVFLMPEQITFHIQLICFAKFISGFALFIERAARIMRTGYVLL